MIITVYDTETNSLDTAGGFIQELGWAKFGISTATNTWHYIKGNSQILAWDIHYDVTDEAQEITGLNRGFCQGYGELPISVFADFIEDVQDSDYLAGHNSIQFDRPMVLSNINRALMLPGEITNIFSQKLHLDSNHDLEFPKRIKYKLLDYLAMKHDYNLKDAHRALADSLACAHIFSRYPIDRTIEIASTPLVRFLHSKVPYGDKITKEKLTAAGFRWNGEKERYELVKRDIFRPEIEKIMEHELYSESVYPEMTRPKSDQLEL